MKHLIGILIRALNPYGVEFVIESPASPEEGDVIVEIEEGAINGFFLKAFVWAHDEWVYNEAGPSGETPFKALIQGQEWLARVGYCTVVVPRELLK